MLQHPCRQPKWVAGLAGLCGLADLFSVAVLVNFELEEPLADGRMLHHREIMLQARAEPHDISCVLEILGRPPLFV